MLMILNLRLIVNAVAFMIHLMLISTRSTTMKTRFISAWMFILIVLSTSNIRRKSFTSLMNVNSSIEIILFIMSTSMLTIALIIQQTTTYTWIDTMSSIIIYRDTTDWISKKRQKKKMMMMMMIFLKMKRKLVPMWIQKRRQQHQHLPKRTPT